MKSLFHVLFMVLFGSFRVCLAEPSHLEGSGTPNGQRQTNTGPSKAHRENHCKLNALILSLQKQKSTLERMEATKAENSQSLGGKGAQLEAGALAFLGSRLLTYPSSRWTEGDEREPIAYSETFRPFQANIALFEKVANSSAWNVDKILTGAIARNIISTTQAIETLTKAAKEHAKGDSNWRLVDFACLPGIAKGYSEQSKDFPNSNLDFHRMISTNKVYANLNKAIEGGYARYFFAATTELAGFFTELTIGQDGKGLGYTIDGNDTRLFPEKYAMTLQNLQATANMGRSVLGKTQGKGMLDIETKEKIPPLLDSVLKDLQALSK